MYVLQKVIVNMILNYNFSAISPLTMILPNVKLKIVIRGNMKYSSRKRIIKRNSESSHHRSYDSHTGSEQEILNNILLIERGKKSSEDQVFIAGKRFVGREACFIKDYVRAIASKARRPFSLKYFNKGYSEEDLEEYEYEIEKAKFLADPKNEDLLIKINELYLDSVFGIGECYYYGIPNCYKVSDLPADKPSREDENFIFIHSDEFLTAMLDAPKYFIEPWVTQINDHFHKVETRKFIFRIGNETLLGELSKDTQRAYNSVAVNAKSSIKFSVYFKGLEEGKFIADRWDYLPLSTHHNKFDENGNFCTYGILVPKTKFSHKHKYNLHNRLVLSQNQSPDIEPTIINKNNSNEENIYNSFDDFCETFINLNNFQKGQIAYEDLVKHGLKKVGKIHCTPYDEAQHTVVRHEELNKSLVSLHQYEYIIDNNNIELPEIFNDNFLTFDSFSSNYSIGSNYENFNPDYILDYFDTLKKSKENKDSKASDEENKKREM